MVTNRLNPYFSFTMIRANISTIYPRAIPPLFQSYPAHLDTAFATRPIVGADWRKPRAGRSAAALIYIYQNANGDRPVSLNLNFEIRKTRRPETNLNLAFTWFVQIERGYSTQSRYHSPKWHNCCTELLQTLNHTKRVAVMSRFVGEENDAVAFGKHAAVPNRSTGNRASGSPDAHAPHDGSRKAALSAPQSAAATAISHGSTSPKASASFSLS